MINRKHVVAVVLGLLCLQPGDISAQCRKGGGGKSFQSFNSMSRISIPFNRISTPQFSSIQQSQIQQQLMMQQLLQQQLLMQQLILQQQRQQQVALQQLLQQASQLPTDTLMRLQQSNNTIVRWAVTYELGRRGQ